MVSKARTAFHSAAAKAERVFTDITKSDPGDAEVDYVGDICDKDLDSPTNGSDSKCHDGAIKVVKKPPPLKTKPDWQERLRNFSIGKKGAEDFEKPGSPTMAFAIFDENLYLVSTTKVSESKDSESDNSVERMTNLDNFAPAVVLKQLAIAIRAGRKHNSMKDLLASSRDSSPVREKAISAMKSLVLREKEDKFTAEFGGDEKVLSLIKSLIDAEGQFPGKKTDSGSDMPSIPSLPKDIHGAPPHSFVVKLSEAIGSLKTLRKMALFWHKVVSELRRLWSEGHYIPGIPPDDIPDLNSCLLYQQLQVINCCISRKKRHSIATEALESVASYANSNSEDLTAQAGCVADGPVLYAQIQTGELVLRIGADKKADNLTLLETGEPLYAPIMQEGPLFTEDLIKEAEELVLQTGSCGAGFSQLLSDMQCFKAANPGCILEDFVRWHSPPDWSEMDPSNKSEDTLESGDLSSIRGHLSGRMQKEGNLWRELWETAKPVAAVKQAPLFDEDLAVEGVLNCLEDFPPFELFEQLFVSLLGSGFVIAEGKLSDNDGLSKLFFECKDYTTATCQGSNWSEKIDDICQVYETVEMMLVKPEEVVKMMKQPEETTPVGESRSRFKRLSFIFRSKDKNIDKLDTKMKDNEAKLPRRKSFPFLFSKKPPRPDTSSPAEKPACPLEND